MSAALRLLPALGVLLLAVLTVSGEEKPRDNKLSPAAENVLDKSEKVELLSLEPGGVADPDPKDPMVFHGYKVLGRTALDKAEVRSAIVEATKKGIADSDGTAARCFLPRHGLHAVLKEQTVDLVICFECLQIEVFVDGKKDKGVLTTRAAQDLYNKTLRDAKVPLSPK